MPLVYGQFELTFDLAVVDDHVRDSVRHRIDAPADAALQRTFGHLQRSVINRAHEHREKLRRDPQRFGLSVDR